MMIDDLFCYYVTVLVTVLVILCCATKSYLSRFMMQRCSKFQFIGNRTFLTSM
ncbi:MAG: hypothetical protein RI894_480 [Bacteroidota bacterium]